MLGDFRLDRKHVRRYEAVWINLGDSATPVRFLADRIGRNDVHGYLITPDPKSPAAPARRITQRRIPHERKEPGGIAPLRSTSRLYVAHSAITTPMGNFTRREILGVAASAGALLAAAAPATIESHVHLFDPERVPYAPGAPYKPAAYTLEDHTKLVEAAGLAHSIIVHPEPYQDDHRYLEYCLAHEPKPGYFKATCLFDPLARGYASPHARPVGTLAQAHRRAAHSRNVDDARGRRADPQPRHERPAHAGLLAGRGVTGDGRADALHPGAGAQHSRSRGEVPADHRDPGSHGPSGTRHRRRNTRRC